MAVCSGVYVAAVVHLEERVLVTDDGRVPMVEVDDTVSVSDASLMSDYYWLLKVGAHWCHDDLLQRDEAHSDTLHVRPKRLHYRTRTCYRNFSPWA